MSKGLLAVICPVFLPLLIAQHVPVSTSTDAAAAQQAAVSPSPSPSQEAAPGAPAEKPRIYIAESQSWSVGGSAGGAEGTFGADSEGGARPQTAEIIKTFGQRCPGVIINNRKNLADYIVVLEHEGGKSFLSHRNKVAVFERASGNVVISESTLSVGGSVDDACKGIAAHWAVHGQALLAARQTAEEPPALAGAASPPATLLSQAVVAIESLPSGADIEVDGAFVGNTPSTINLASGVHEISIKKKGFADWHRKLTVTGGSIHLNATLEPAQAER